MATLIALAGLPGSGKSTLARLLAGRIGACWLRVDTIEQAIRASAAAPADPGDWGYRAAQALAADNLRLGRDVVADAVNDVREARDGWQAAADRAGAAIRWLEVVCSDPVEHRRRVETRASDIVGHVLPTWGEVLARCYEPWDRDRAVIDTAHRPPAACLADMRTAIAPAEGVSAPAPAP